MRFFFGATKFFRQKQFFFVEFLMDFHDSDSKFDSTISLIIHNFSFPHSSSNEEKTHEIEEWTEEPCTAPMENAFNSIREVFVFSSV